MDIKSSIKNIWKSRFSRIIIPIIIYRIVLDCTYKYIVSPGYAFTGMTVNFAVIRYILSWLMLVYFVYLFSMLLYDRRCGAIILSILMMSSAIPTTGIIAFFDIGVEFYILNLIYWSLLIILYVKSDYLFKRIFHTNSNKLYVRYYNSKTRRYIPKFIIEGIFIFFAIVVLYIWIRYTHFHLSVNIFDVYNTRAKFDTYDIPTILIYLFSASIIVFPIIMVYGLRQKNYLLSVFSVIFQILSFSIDGRKSAIFVLIFTLAFYFVGEFLSILFIPYAFAGISILGVLELSIFGTIFIHDFITRRLFILPAYLQYSYYDFFKGAEKDFFRQGLMGRFGFVSPYSEKIPKLIGAQYYLNSYANNGLFADAYSNLGVVGVFIMPILIVLALKILDYCSYDLDIRFCSAVIFISSYTLLSSSFFVVMLTHGFLLSCLIMYLIPRRRRING